MNFAFHVLCFICFLYVTCLDYTDDVVFEVNLAITIILLGVMGCLPTQNYSTRISNVLV